RLREFFAKRGITVGASGLVVIISANAVQAAPVGLAVTISTAAALAGTTILTTTAATVGKAIAMTTMQKVLVALAAVLVLTIGGTITLVFLAPAKAPVKKLSNPPAAVENLTSTTPVGSAPFQHKSPEYAAFPYAKGFPLVLPGSITGSAVLLDLDGDGKLEIAVPCIGRLPQHYNRYDRELHPSPSLAGQIFAFRADGSTYPNFPMVIREAAFRKRWERLDWHWNFSPSVADTDKNGTDELIVGGHVLFGDGIHETLSNNQEPYGSVALADVDGDGDLDMLAGWTVHSVRGAPIRDWPRDRKFFPGYSPAVGDANGDGFVEIFHPHYGPEKIFGGYDHLKRPLPGWPRPIADPIIYPVMGDMDGDGKAEILGVDFSTRSLLGQLHAWHHDGRPLAACKKIDDDDSIFKTDLFSGFTHPALADLDGDGAAEILILDWETRSVRAWKSDGKPAVPPGDPSLPDGHLVTLPPQRNSGYGAAGGISVADLGNDGVMDVFVGTTWFQITRDGKSRAIDMTPGHPQCTVTPTIADLDGDGKAEILFGTTDGRLFVYQTGLEVRPEWIEWAMQEGNVRHTAMWIPRKLRTGRP
ncbi:MAG TPA: VCBS repeat-containing protein, partial [Tepidisphaeraceae bacterium]|nr:VCBS repeat-containing protein [Tepidisphaeraceae bacterium]